MENNATKILLSDEEKNKIVGILSERLGSFGCPMCKKIGFAIADGYFVQTLQGDLKKGVFLNGQMIPSIAIICEHCGFISQHALGKLGLLTNIGNEK